MAKWVASPDFVQLTVHTPLTLYMPLLQEPIGSWLNVFIPAPTLSSLLIIHKIGGGSAHEGSALRELKRPNDFRKGVWMCVIAVIPVTSATTHIGLLAH